jgi:hypothetical protein
MNETVIGNARWVKSDEVVMRKVGGEMILVPIRANVGDLDSVYTLSDVAARVWAMLDGSHTTEQIEKQLCAEYDVAPEAARSDLLALLESLEESSLVTRADG